MAQAGLMKRDMLLNAFVRHKVADHSRLRLDRVLATGPQAGGPAGAGGAGPGRVDALVPAPAEPAAVRRGLRVLHRARALAAQEPERGRPRFCRHPRQHRPALSSRGTPTASGCGGTGPRSASWPKSAGGWPRWCSIRSWPRSLRYTRPAPICWSSSISRNCTRPSSGTCCCASEVKDIDAALERALMFLHEQRVIVLQQGLAVFRSAMTIRFQPEAEARNTRPPTTSPSSTITRSESCRCM